MDIVGAYIITNNNRQMGQDQCNPTEHSIDAHCSRNTHRSKKHFTSNSTPKSNANIAINPQLNPHSQRVDIANQQLPLLVHDGILKLSTLPFTNSVEVCVADKEMFLQSIGYALSQLLEPRMGTNRLFPMHQIISLLQSLVYTLAFYESKEVVYPDIKSQFVTYTDGRFKLMPTQLIPSSTYLRILSYWNQTNQETDNQEGQDQPIQIPCCSPEMIIALRCNQTSIVDKDILWKSIVFEVGMLMLQVCTLQESGDCYDADTYDILDSVIAQRLILVEELYCEALARIIGNMLDYDYSERMGMKEMAIFISREIKTISQPATSLTAVSQPAPPNTNITDSNGKSKSRLITSNAMGCSNAVQSMAATSSSANMAKSKSTKSNLVYMNNASKDSLDSGYCAKEEKNRVYLENSKAAYQEHKQNFQQGRSTYQEQRPNFQENRPTYQQNRANFQQNRTNFQQNRANFQQNRANFQQNRANFQQNRTILNQIKNSQQPQAGSKMQRNALDKVHYLNQQLLNYQYNEKAQEDRFDKPYQKSKKITDEYINIQLSHPYKNSCAIPHGNTSVIKANPSHTNTHANPYKYPAGNQHYPSLQNLFKGNAVYSSNQEENQPTAKFRKNLKEDREGEREKEREGKDTSKAKYDRHESKHDRHESKHDRHEPKYQEKNRQETRQQTRAEQKLKANQNGGDESSNGNSSISRIKEEILKSRKLIQEFKKNEGIKY